MRAVVYRAPGQVAVETVAEPQVEQPDDAVVRVSLSAIGVADLRFYAGVADRPAGGSMGSEFVGTVESVGPGVRRLQAGQRVVAPVAVFCGGCFYCKQGLLGACEERQVFGGGALGGGQAERVRVPRADAVLEPLPLALADEKAIYLADLLPGPFAGLEAAGLKPGQAVAVVGCGPLGLAAQLLAHAAGAGRVFALDDHAYRREAAGRLGTTVLDAGSAAAAVRSQTGGRGADVVVDTSRAGVGISQAASLVRPLGTLLSLLGADRAAGRDLLAALIDRQVRLLPLSGPPTRNYQALVMNMLERGVIDPTPLTSHTLALDEAPRGYEIAAKRLDGALKVLLRP